MTTSRSTTSSLSALLAASLGDRVLFESATLLVIDKPAGLAVDAPEHADDLARIVRRALARGGGDRRYVGAVHRLERDASGPCVLTLDRSVNARVSTPLERRAARRTVLAVVRAGIDERALSRLFNGSARVHERNARGALVSFDPGMDKLQTFVERAGDALLAPLHVRALEVCVEPARVAMIEAPLPWSLVDALSSARTPALLLDHALLAQRLRAGLWRRARLTDDLETDAYRLAHEEGDGVLGLAVDRYADWAVAHVYETSNEQRADTEAYATIGRALGARGVYVKFRRKQSNTLVDTRREDVAPTSAVWGEGAERDSVVVRECGVRYVARLGDGLSTGIFLDQRESRAWIRQRAKGRSLLNLFAYTGAFTVAAAVGGARASLSVDASRGAVAWLREHLRENAQVIDDPSAHEGACVEVFGWLEGARARGDRYELIVCDPPSYSFAKDGPRWTSERDWPELAAKTLALAAPSALVLFSSNHRAISAAKFEAMLREGARRAGVALAQLERKEAPEDFPKPPGGWGHLKIVRATVQR
jgi:23S rRNA (cytosine1962-C5)-methyltransferase